MPKIIRLVLAYLIMTAGAVFVVTAANAPAGANPYKHPFKCTEVTRVKANGTTIVTLRCSGTIQDGPEKGQVRKYQCRLAPVPKPCKGPLLPGVLVVLHSKPQVLGAFSPDANGNVDATVTIPSGFTGNHTIEARLVTKNTTTAVAPVLSKQAALVSTRVMMPLTVGKSSSVTKTAALPATTDDSSGLGAVAIVGIAALGVVMLVGGGLLLFTGRRRRVSVAAA